MADKLDAVKKQLSKSPSGELAELYVNLRKQRDAHRTCEKKIQKKMDFLAGIIKQKMLDDKTTAFHSATSNHSVFSYTLRSVQVTDPEVFAKFVFENGEYELIERRASQAGCDAYQQEHGEAPPGVALVEIEKLSVRKGR